MGTKAWESTFAIKQPISPKLNHQDLDGCSSLLPSRVPLLKSHDQAARGTGIPASPGVVQARSVLGRFGVSGWELRIRSCAGSKRPNHRGIHRACRPSIFETFALRPRDNVPSKQKQALTVLHLPGLTRLSRSKPRRVLWSRCIFSFPVPSFLAPVALGLDGLAGLGSDFFLCFLFLFWRGLGWVGGSIFFERSFCF